MGSHCDAYLLITLFENLSAVCFEFYASENAKLFGEFGFIHESHELAVKPRSCGAVRHPSPIKCLQKRSRVAKLWPTVATVFLTWCGKVMC